MLVLDAKARERDERGNSGRGFVMSSTIGERINNRQGLVASSTARGEEK